jgi:hypothetical protein
MLALTASKKRHLEPDPAMLVAGVAVLVFLGRVCPPIRRQ